MQRYICKISKWFVLLIGIFLIGLIGLYLSRNAVITPHLSAYLERFIAAELGMRVSIGRLGGTFFSVLEIEDVVTLEQNTDGPLTAIALRQGKLTYQLSDLLQGVQAFLSGTTLSVDGLSLALDLSRLATDDEVDTAALAISFPASLPQIRITDGSVLIRNDNFKTGFTGISLVSSPAEPGVSHVQYHVNKWSWTHKDFKDGSLRLDGELRYASGQVTSATLTADGRPMVESLATDLNHLPDRLPFQASISFGNGRLETEGHLDDNRLTVNLEGSAIDLAGINGLLAAGVPALKGLLSIQARLDIPLAAAADMDAQLTLDVAGGSYSGQEVDRITAKLVAGNGLLQLHDLEIVEGRNRVTVQQLSAPAEAVFAGDIDRIIAAADAQWSADCRDVPHLLKMAGITAEYISGTIPEHRLDIAGRMSGGEILIPEGRLELTDGHVRLQSARLTLPRSDLHYRDAPMTADLDVLLPDMELLSRIFALPKLGGSIRANLNLKGTLAAPEGMVALTSENTTYRGTLLGNLQVQAITNSEKLTLQSVVLQRGNDRSEGRGSIDLSNGNAFENMQISIDVSNLSPYQTEIIPLFWQLPEHMPLISGRLSAHGRLAGSVREPKVTVELRTRKIRLDETPIGDGDALFDASPQGLRVHSAKFHHLDDRVELSGSYTASNRRLEKLALAVDVFQPSRYKALWQNDGIDFAGPVRVGLTASGDLHQPEADAEIRLSKLHINNIRVAETVLKLHNSGPRLNIEAFTMVTEEEKISLSASLVRNPDDTVFDIRIQQADLVRRGPLLSLERPARIQLSRNGSAQIDSLSLAGPAGRVTLKGRYSPNAASDLIIDAVDIRSDGWLDRFVSDRVQFKRVSAHVRLSGPPGAITVRATGDIDALGSPQVPVVYRGQFDIDYHNRKLKIRKFDWQAPPDQRIELQGSLPINLFGPQYTAPGKIALTGRISVTDVGSLAFLIPRYGLTSGSLEAGFDIRGTWQTPRGNIDLQINNLNRPRDFSSLPPAPYAISGKATITGSRLELESLVLNAAGLQASLKGHWSGMPSPAALMQSGQPLLSGRIDIEGTLAAPDVSWIAVEIPGVRRMNGQIEAHGRLHGPIKAPAINAFVRLSDGELALNADMPSLRTLNLEADLVTDTINIQVMTGELGSAPFALTGTLAITPEGAATDIQLKGENLLLYRSEGLLVRADTDLQLRGPMSRLELSGQIAITNGRYSKNISMLDGLISGNGTPSDPGTSLFSITDPPLRDMRFDIEISSKKPFLIQNNVVRGALRPDLRLSGTGELPVLTGKIYLDPTRLNLPAGRLNFDTGLVRFETIAPDRPQLDLVGTTSMLGYDITAVIEGPYDEPLVTLSSVPPLPDKELLLLLLAGQPPQTTGRQADASNRNLQIAAYIGKDILAKWFDGDANEATEFILDRFDVEIGRGITQQGEETMHASFRMADNVFFDGDGLYLTGERDVFDYFNGGVKLVFRFR